MNRQKVKVAAGDVTLIPHRGKVGNLAPLTEYFQNSDGELLPPAVVRDRNSGKYVLIGGERRWRAAVRASELPLYVIVCDFWGDYLAWLALDKLKVNPAHPEMPTPVTDIVVLTASLLRYLSPGRDDHMDDTVAEYYGIKPGRIGETRSIKKIKDRHNNPPEIQRMVDEEWDALGKGLVAPSAAFQRIRKAEIKRVTPPGDVRVQRSKLVGAAQVCAGLVDALTTFGDVSPELTDEEISNGFKGLADGRRVLDTLVRRLQNTYAERGIGS